MSFSDPLYTYYRDLTPGDLRKAWETLQEGALGDGLLVTPTTGLSVSIAAGTGFVEGDEVADQGLYRIHTPISVPSAEFATGEIQAAHNSRPRLDQIVVQVLDDTHDASGDFAVQPMVLTGTATVGATLDNRSGAAALPDSCLLLADVLVPAGATTLVSGDIRDRRPDAAAAFVDATIEALEDLLALKQDLDEKGQPDGYASLDGSGKVPASELPDDAIEVTDGTTTVDPAASIAFSGPVEVTDGTGGVAEVEVTAQPLDEKGQADGYASLDGGGKVPGAQLPNSIMEYKGVWDASTNTPTLADGTGGAGDVYRVTVAGSQDLGSGSISFDVGDYAVHNGSTWEKSDTTDSVPTVFGRTGNVEAQSGDYEVGEVTGAAPLASPTFTGDPKAPTPAAGDDDTSIATTAYVRGEVEEEATARATHEAETTDVHGIADTADLVAYRRFAEALTGEFASLAFHFHPNPAAAVVEDLTGNYTATLTNGATVTADELVDGEPGAVSLDGTNDYVATDAGTRRNLAKNPRAAVDASIVGVSGLDYTGAAVTRVACSWNADEDWCFNVTGLHSGTTARALALHFATSTSDYAPAAPGQVWSASARVHTVDPSVAAAAIRGYNLFLRYRNSGGALLSTERNTGVVDEGVSDLLLTITGTAAPANTAYVEAAVELWSDTDADTVTYQATRLLLERAAAPGPYFDGDSEDAGWLGTAHASASDKGPLGNGKPLTVAGVAKRDNQSAAHTLLGGSVASNATRLVLASGSGDVTLRIAATDYTWTGAWPNDTDPHLWALEFNETADTAKLYIDGVLVSEKTGVTAQHAARQTLVVGAHGSGTDPFDGLSGPLAGGYEALTAGQHAYLHHVARPALFASPSGGATVDAEAREAIEAIRRELQRLGLS